jgi:hypothetical protein
MFQVSRFVFMVQVQEFGTGTWNPERGTRNVEPYWFSPQKGHFAVRA